MKKVAMILLIVSLSIMVSKTLFGFSSPTEELPGTETLFPTCAVVDNYSTGGWSLECQTTTDFLEDAPDKIFLYIPDHEVLTLNGHITNNSNGENYDLATLFHNGYNNYAELPITEAINSDMTLTLKINLNAYPDGYFSFLQGLIDNIIYAPYYESTVDLDDYNRFYKDEDGTWHGVMQITDSVIIYDHITDKDAIYIKFSRDTNYLKEITYDYTTEEYCAGTQFVFCFGDKAVDTGTETIYDYDNQGYFSWLLFGEKSGIHEYQPADFDYIIYSEVYPETSRRLDTVEVVEFTYQLTNAEVDALNQETQYYYNQELRGILTDTSTTIEEKETLLADLNERFSDQTIDYEEDIQQLCETDDSCTIESSFPGDEDRDDDWFLPFLDIAKQVGIILGGAVIGGAVIVAVLHRFINFSINLSIAAIGKGFTVTYEIVNFYISKVAKGFTYFFTTIFSVFKR